MGVGYQASLLFLRRGLLLLAVALLFGCRGGVPRDATSASGAPPPVPAGLAPDEPVVGPLRIVADPEAPRALLLGWRAEVADVLGEIVARTPLSVVVYLLAPPQEADTARTTLAASGRAVHVLAIPVQSPWARDWAGVLARDDLGRTVLVDPRYGGGRAEDDEVPLRLAERWKAARVPLSLALEGGNLVASPGGRCFTTRRLLDRNGELTEEEVFSRLRETAGCARTVLLPTLPRDPTGHADMLVSFVGGTALVAEAFPPASRDQRILDGVHDDVGMALAGETPPLRVVHLPLVRTRRGLALSFVQVLPLGNRLLVPDYAGAGVPSPVLRAQRLAWQRLRAAFPDKELAAVRLTPRIELGGGLHCYVMALP